MCGGMTKKVSKSDRCIRRSGRKSTRKEWGRGYGMCCRAWLKKWQRISRGIGGRMTRGQRKDCKKWPEELEEGCDKVMEGSFSGHRADGAEKG